jgi:hypothetical protein
LLIAQCINKRPNYLARVWEGDADFRSFDFAISATLARIARGGQIHNTADWLVEQLTTVRGLPEALGGLNIEPYHTSVRRAQGLVASRAFVAAFVEQHVPWLVGPVRAVEEQPSVVGWVEAVITHNPTLSARFVGKERPQEIREEALAIQSEDFHAHLKRSGQVAESRRLASASFAGSARWMYWFGGIRHQSLWRDLDFRMALRSRLLLPLCSNASPAGSSLPCACGSFGNILSAGQDHLLLCPLNRAVATQRHTLLRNTLAAFCAGYCKDGGSVVMEPMLGLSHRADVLMRRNNGVMRLIEAGVTSSFASHLEMTEWAPGLSASMLEDDKRDRFAEKLLAEAGNVTDYAREAADTEAFVPFAVESTGRLGTAARRFLEELPKTRGSYFTKKELLNEMSALLAQASARMRLDGLHRAERLVGRAV